MRYLDFTGLTSKINTRKALQRYLDDDVPEDPVVALSESYPDVYLPYKYLPVVFQTKTHEEGIVAVKGTIMALVGQMAGFGDASIYHPIPSNTGVEGISTIHLGQNYSADGINTVSSDNSHYAYDNLHLGVVVPCNNGQGVTLSYTSHDEILGTVKPNGNLAAEDDTIIIPANKPFGVAMGHYVTDMRGRNINYYPVGDARTTVYRKGFISVPFVNWAKVCATYPTGTNTDGNFSLSSAYAAIRDVIPFAYTDSNTNYAESRDYVTSDKYGRFLIDSTITSPTKLTIGNFIDAQFKFPAGRLNAYVDNKIDSALMGTNTGGIPEVLFILAGSVMTEVTGTAPTIQEIVTAVQNGLFGIAKIDFQM